MAVGGFTEGMLEPSLKGLGGRFISSSRFLRQSYNMYCSAFLQLRHQQCLTQAKHHTVRILKTSITKTQISDTQSRVGTVKHGTFGV